MKRLLLAIVLSGLAAQVRAEDLVVADGQTVDISSDATYETVTVNGTLNVQAKLTFTNIYIADGVGASGTVNVTGSGTLAQVNSSSDKSIFIGYNGGNGVLKLNSSKELAAGFLVLGHGGGECTFELVGKYYQGWSVKKLGAGTCHMQFNGAYLKLSSDFFVIDDGILQVESLNNKSIDVRPYNSGSKNFASGNGKLVITGGGSISFYSYLTAQYAQNARMKLQGPKGGLDLSEFTGAVAFSGNDRENPTTFQLMQDDFLCSTSAALQLNTSQILDLNGHKAAAKDLTCWSDTTSFSLINSATTPGEISVVSSINPKIQLGENVNIRKIGSTTLTYSGTQIHGALEVVDGTFAFSNDAEVGGDIVQVETGLISIAADKTLTVSGSLWKNPEFTSDSKGAVNVSAAAQTVIDTEALSFSGDLTVSSGKLLIGTRTSTSPHRYFRLTFLDNYNSTATISETVTPKDLVIVSEFSLFDADGNRLNSGLKAAAAGTSAKDLKPGTCCYAAAYLEGMSGVPDLTDVSSGVANLFDTYVSSCVYFRDLNWVEGSSDNAPRVILFRLADDKTADAVRYQLYSSNKTSTYGGSAKALVPCGNVTKWTLEGSSDGIHWQIIDAREQRAAADQVMASNTQYKNGPFSLSADFVKEAESVSFAAGAKVSVMPGATLDVFAESCEIANLETDCGQQGRATLAGCSLAQIGSLSLVNVPEPFTRVALPIVFDSVSQAENFPNWSVLVNGAEETEGKLKCINGSWALVRPSGLYIIFN